jgi:hypothetical protein
MVTKASPLTTAVFNKSDSIRLGRTCSRHGQQPGGSRADRKRLFEGNWGLSLQPKEFNHNPEKLGILEAEGKRAFLRTVLLNYIVSGCKNVL